MIDIDFNQSKTHMIQQYDSRKKDNPTMTHACQLCKIKTENGQIENWSVTVLRTSGPKCRNNRQPRGTDRNNYLFSRLVAGRQSKKKKNWLT